MSDISILSHEYKVASTLSQMLSQSLILLKKAHYALPGRERITSEAITVSQRELADILMALAHMMKQEPSQKIEEAITLQIPRVLVVRLQNERSGDLDYYLDDLTQAADRLRQGIDQLQEKDFALLDHVAQEADIQASSVFRRMMRM